MQLLDYLGPKYYMLSHRFWEGVYFSLDFPLFVPLLVLTLAMGVWLLLREPRLLLLPLIASSSSLFLDLGVGVAIAFLISVFIFLYLSRRFQEYYMGLLAIVLAVEFSALLHWLVFNPLGLEDPLQSLTSIELSVFYLIAQINPYYMLSFTLVGIGVSLYYLYRKPTNADVGSEEKSMLSNRVYLAFGLVLVLSIVVAIYPFLPNVNPNQVNPGVDISDYESDYYVIAADPSQMFTTMGGSRPIYYLTLFAFQRVLSLDPLNTIRLFPILLNPLLCASVFILTRETARESYLAAYASFFTVSGFTLSVGMYAYWLADMLMLSIVFLSLAALLKALKEKSRIYLATAILLGCLFVFTHPWTFDQYMAAFGGAAVIAFIDLRRGERSYETVWLIFYCAVVASTDVLKLILLRGSVEGVAAIVFLSSSLTTPATFWLNLVNSSRFYVGGYLTNMPLLALAALGIVKARQRILANLFFWVLIGATSVVYLVGDVVIKSRVLYNIPVGVLAAYGVAYIDELNVGARLKLILKAAIIVSLLSYLFRDLANLI